MVRFSTRENVFFSMSKAVLAFILLAWFINTVQAEGFDFYAHVNKYAKCEAVQNVMANISSESEQEFYQHELHHASLDSRIVALEFARAGKYEEGLVDELYNTYLDEYREELKESKDVDKFVAALHPYIKECRRLNAMQSDVIARKKQQRLKQDGNYIK